MLQILYLWIKLYMIVCRFVGDNLVEIYLYYYVAILSNFFISIINK